MGELVGDHRKEDHRTYNTSNLEAVRTHTSIMYFYILDFSKVDLIKWPHSVDLHFWCPGQKYIHLYTGS